MATSIRKDSLTKYQATLSKMLMISSPIAGLFTGNEIDAGELQSSRSVRIPFIEVDDYIVDADFSRIGADHYSGSEFTTEWKNGVPPTFYREYSMSRHRAFGYTVFDEQLKYSPIKNIVQEYTARKMQYTVLRDHDKYVLLGGLMGRMTGKMVPLTAADTVGPVTANAHLIANTGNAADYKWISEPSEDQDNELQPSFASVKCMELDLVDPLLTLDALTLKFSDNWFDSNFGNSERVLIVTSALELVFINALIDAGAGTESAFKLVRDGDVSGALGSSYLGTLKGSWHLIKIHPEFLPKLFVNDTTLVVDPVHTTNAAYTAKPNASTGVSTVTGYTLRQVAALAVYKNAIQTQNYFDERRQEDGGTRFKGTEYVQDFSYDVWAIDQYSEGIVPLLVPAAAAATVYGDVTDSFANVAALVAAGRARLGGETGYQYPINPAQPVPSAPGWFTSPYDYTPYIDASKPLATGDISTEYVATVAARANSTAVALNALLTSGGRTFQVIAAGTTAAAVPAGLAAAPLGGVVTDGTATVRRVA